MSHTHLTLEERVSIEIFVSMGMSCREMARRLGRSHSTLSRELRRNAGSAKKVIVRRAQSGVPTKGERDQGITAVCAVPN